MQSSPAPLFSHILRANPSSLPSDIIDSIFWHVLTAPYMPLLPLSTPKSLVDVEDMSSLEDFIDNSRHLNPDDCAEVSEYIIPRHSSHGYSAEQLNTPLWKPSKKWTWISGKIPENTIDQLLLKERKRYNVHLTTCEIDKKAVSYISKCWPISPHSKAVNNEIQLYKTGLNSLQGLIVPSLIQVFVRPGILNVAFELPHDTFWIEASSDMPSMLKKRCIEAFHCIHAHGILHGAVDFSSILIGGDGNVYICDFESSRLITGENSIEAAEELEKVKYMLYSSKDRGMPSLRRPRRFVVPGTSSTELEIAIHKFMQTLIPSGDKPSGVDISPRYSPPPSFENGQRINDKKTEFRADAGELPRHSYSLRKRKTTSGPSTESRPRKRGRTTEESPISAIPLGAGHQKRSRKAETIEHIVIRPSRPDEFRGDGIIHDSILFNNLNPSLPIIKVRDFGLDGIVSHPRHLLHVQTPHVYPARVTASKSRKRAREEDWRSTEGTNKYDISVGGTLKKRRCSTQPTAVHPPKIRLPTLSAFSSIPSTQTGERDNRTRRGIEITATLEGDTSFSSIDTNKSDRGSRFMKYTLEKNPRASWWEITKPIARIVTAVAGPSSLPIRNYDVATNDTSRGLPVQTVENRAVFPMSRWMDRIWRLVA
ncbi:hypothetical protein BDQ17DRAFT_1340894 [Cyathus striatus]|nr:hypothetical protein BDQ17DRAFT_1340894 [Cyathus striatus]